MSQKNQQSQMPNEEELCPHCKPQFNDFEKQSDHYGKNSFRVKVPKTISSKSELRLTADEYTVEDGTLSFWGIYHRYASEENESGRKRMRLVSFAPGMWIEVITVDVVYEIERISEPIESEGGEHVSNN